MNEQVPAEKSDTPRTDEAEAIRQNGGDVSDIFAAMRQLERELTEAMRSLSREENARKVLANENDRLRAASVHNAKHDVTGWICSVCHGWNKVTDQHCVHIHSGVIRSQQ